MHSTYLQFTNSLSQLNASMMYRVDHIVVINIKTDWLSNCEIIVNQFILHTDYSII